MKKILILISLTILTLFPLHSSFSFLGPKKTDQETRKLLELFVDVFAEIKKRYVEEIDDKQAIEAAINGMLTSLDPHSMFLDSKSFDDIIVDTKGEFGGLGMEVTTENGLVKVFAAIDDTPAYKAGIKSGDYIVAINDESLLGMNLHEVVKILRGKPGEKIHLTLIREGKNEPIELDMIREIIKITAVQSKYINNIAYFRISKFSEQTTISLKAEIKKILENHKKNEIDGVVLDLRDNPGGILDQAISVSDCFLDQGEVVSIRSREDSDNKSYKISGKDLLKNIQMVVLINGGSASASEIVAGALQDHKRAIIMGTKSFGKANVQVIFPIPPYGAIKLTTARYYTPSGRSIQAEGIIPDIEVDEAKIEINNNKDNRKFFAESKLKKHLKKEPEKNIKLDKNALVSKVNNKFASEDIYKSDFQLARAIDVLKALKVLNGKLQ